jgi:hypothetical protein
MKLIFKTGVNGTIEDMSDCYLCRSEVSHMLDCWCLFKCNGSRYDWLIDNQYMCPCVVSPCWCWITFGSRYDWLIDNQYLCPCEMSPCWCWIKWFGSRYDWLIDYRYLCPCEVSPCWCWIKWFGSRYNWLIDYRYLCPCEMSPCWCWISYNAASTHQHTIVVLTAPHL